MLFLSAYAHKTYSGFYLCSRSCEFSKLQRPGHPLSHLSHRKKPRERESSRPKGLVNPSKPFRTRRGAMEDTTGMIHVRTLATRQN